MVKKGQILIITLLVLTILSILSISIIVLNNRDAGQVVANLKYEQAYNVAETELNSLIQIYGDYQTNLSALSIDCLELEPNNWYECTKTRSDLNSDTAYNVETNIRNEKEIQRYELAKDRSLDIYLNGYSSGLDIRWFDNSGLLGAMEMTLVFKTPTGDYKVVKDLFDKYGIFDTKNATSVFSYQSIESDLTRQNSSTRINIGTTKINLIANALNNSVNLTNSDIPYYLKLTLRSNSAQAVLPLSVQSTDPASFPSQVRTFTASSFDNNASNTSTPVANVESVVPLFGQLGGIFDYALISEDEVKNN